MLPLGLFKRRNFAVGNLQTFAMYGGLGVTFFLLVLFLQEVAGYDALEAGLALMPSTLVMFLLSKRMGRLADRYGPRLFMGLGPLTAAAGLALMLRLDAHVELRDRPAAGAARLLARAGVHRRAAHRDRALRRRRVQRRDRVGRQQRDRARRRAARRSRRSARSSRRSSARRSTSGWPGARSRRPPGPPSRRRARQTLARGDPARAGADVAHAVQSASVHAFHVGIGISATLVALGGVLGLAGIRNPRRVVRCEDCAGGQLAGQPLDAARLPVKERVPRPASVGG